MREPTAESVEYDNPAGLQNCKTQKFTCTLYKVDKDGKESRGRADSSNLRLVAIIYSEV